ncbi:unnamed protein product [Clavelina lepadiformis]|uniref:Uncharacterized protein n=1 Tax=Clavelina lepadiformis TaxID=159417 RepID=A0ABP0GGN6_CLALP
MFLSSCNSPKLNYLLCRENVTVTPTLTCLPSGMQCIKPVTITLLSSYKDMNVNVMAQNRIGRIKKDVVSCESGVVTFETKSFDCFWGVKEASNSNEADTKSMLFKLMPSDKKTSDPILECRILDSYADVADEDPKSYFQIDVKSNKNITDQIVECRICDGYVTDGDRQFCFDFNVKYDSCYVASGIVHEGH